MRIKTYNVEFETHLVENGVEIEVLGVEVTSAQVQTNVGYFRNGFSYRLLVSSLINVNEETCTGSQGDRTCSYYMTRYRRGKSKVMEDADLQTPLKTSRRAPFSTFDTQIVPGHGQCLQTLPL